MEPPKITFEEFLRQMVRQRGLIGRMRVLTRYWQAVRKLPRSERERVALALGSEMTWKQLEKFFARDGLLSEEEQVVKKALEGVGRADPGELRQLASKIRAGEYEHVRAGVFDLIRQALEEEAAAEQAAAPPEDAGEAAAEQAAMPLEDVGAAPAEAAATPLEDVGEAAADAAEVVEGAGAPPAVGAGEEATGDAREAIAGIPDEPAQAGSEAIGDEPGGLPEAVAVADEPSEASVAPSAPELAASAFEEQVLTEEASEAVPEEQADKPVDAATPAAGPVDAATLFDETVEFAIPEAGAEADGGESPDGAVDQAVPAVPTSVAVAPEDDRFTAVDRLRILHRLRSGGVGIDTADPGQRAHLVASLGPGWAARRALSEMISAGTIADLEEALRLARGLSSGAQQSWCLGDIVARWELDELQLERVLEAAPSPAARRRLESRARRSQRI